MSIVRAEAAAEIPFAPERVFGLISDLEARPSFLPPAFQDFRVESAEDRLVSYTLATGGRTRHYRMRVTESAPGMLTESDLESSLVTTYTVTPAGEGSRVVISTSWQGAKGIGGFFERTFAPRALAKLYTDELGRLESALRGTQAG